MAITKLPRTIPAPQTCAICRVPLSLDKATAGLLDIQGHQAFACVSHFSEVDTLILGWVDFIAKERYKSLHCGLGLQELLNEAGGHHARPDR